MKQFVIYLLIGFFSFVNLLAQKPGAVTIIPFELVGDHIFIKVVVNGSRELDFLFDSGAGKTIVDSQTAEELNLLSGRLKKASGASASFKTPTLKNALITIGNLQLDKTDLLNSSLAHLEDGIGKDFDGIIGYHLLKKLVVKINYDTFEIEIRSAKGFKYTGDGTIVNFKNKTSHPYMDAHMVFPDGDTLMGEFILDTGAGCGIGLCTPFCKENDLFRKFTDSSSKQTNGFANGNTTIKSGIIKNLIINELNFQEVSTDLYTVDSGFFSSERPNGLIGNRVLKKFNITFNYREKKTYWEPNKRFNTP